jgi:hypothetical protein
MAKLPEEQAYDDVEVVEGEPTSADVEVEAPKEEEPEPTEEEVAEPVEEPAEEEPPAEVEVDEPPEVTPEQLTSEIEELEKQKAEAKEKAEYWRKQRREERDRYFRDTEPPEEPAPAEEPAFDPSEFGPKPSEGDFETYDEYVEALAGWKADIKTAERLQTYERQSRERTVFQRLDTWRNGVIERGREKYEDFEDVAEDPTVPISTVMLEIMMENDLQNPEDIAYYLARNTRECINIGRMTPIKASRALTQLETKIQAELETNPPIEPKPKPASKAPPPVKPITGQGTTHKLPLDHPDVSEEEYRQRREAGEDN